MHKESRLLRVGILGAGPIAQFAHLEAARRARNTELYALCEHADDLRERMALVHQPRAVYARYEEMLADNNVEAVIVATTDAFHVPLSLAAIRAGKHVVVEKPLGVTVEECEELERAVSESGLTLQVGFNCRFDPALAFAKDFIDTETGPLAIFNAWYCDSVARYTMTDNLQPIPVHSEQRRKPPEDPKADKRRYFLTTHGTHVFDTAAYLAGSIRAVQARWQEVDGAHHWSVSVDFESGCFGNISIIVPARADFQQGVHAFGPKGSVQGKLHLPWYRKAGDIECFSARDQTFRHPLGADADTYKLQLEGFADVILKNLPQRGATIHDGTANVRALVATAHSVEQGGWWRTDDISGSV